MDTPLKVKAEPYLDDIKHRRLTVKQVARTLNVSYTYLSRVLNQMGAGPEPSTRQEDRRKKKELTQTRKQHREHLAKSMPLDQAAKAAKCHPRTIRRILEKSNAKP